MSEEMFHSIVEQLAEIGYSGRFTTFSNNEPLLDELIIDNYQQELKLIKP